MSFSLYAFAVIVVLFLCSIGCVIIGLRSGRKRIAVIGVEPDDGHTAVDTVVFGLLGLLLAFTFTSAASRFHDRIQRIKDEANAIGTSWSRLQLLPEAERVGLQKLFKARLDAEISAWGSSDNPAQAMAKFKEMQLIQNELWTLAVNTVKDDPIKRHANLILPPLNQLFDITEQRILSTRDHPPAIVYVLLGFMLLVSALFVGFNMAKTKKLSWLHIIGFSFVTSVAVFFILDFEYPRLGFIKVNFFDQAIIDVRDNL